MPLQRSAVCEASTKGKCDTVPRHVRFVIRSTYATCTQDGVLRAHATLQFTMFRASPAHFRDPLSPLLSLSPSPSFSASSTLPLSLRPSASLTLPLYSPLSLSLPLSPFSPPSTSLIGNGGGGWGGGGRLSWSKRGGWPKVIGKPSAKFAYGKIILSRGQQFKIRSRCSELGSWKHGHCTQTTTKTFLRGSSFCHVLSQRACHGSGTWGGNSGDW